MNTGDIHVDVFSKALKQSLIQTDVSTTAGVGRPGSLNEMQLAP